MATADDGGRPPDDRWRCRRVGLVAAALLALGGVFVAIRLTLPSDGTLTSAAAPQPDGVRIGVLLRDTGLREGDIVTAVDGRPVTQLSLPDPEVGDVQAYRLRRSGEVRDVDVRIRRYPVGAALGRNWPSVVLVGAVLVVAGYVFVRRPEDRAGRALLVFASFLACGSTAWIFGLQVTDLDGGAGWWANLGGGVAYILVWPALLRFAVVFPEDHRLVRRHPTVLRLVWALPVVVYAGGVVLDFPEAGTPLARVGALVPRSTFDEFLFAGLIVATFMSTYRWARDPGTRTRLRWVAGTFAVVAVLYLALWELPVLLTGSSPFLSQPVHPLLFLPCPIAIAAAILRLHLFDIDVVVRRSLVYFGLTACLLAVYALTVGLLKIGRASCRERV
jgi:two-component system NarL family sensor kinase